MIRGHVLLGCTDHVLSLVVLGAQSQIIPQSYTYMPDPIQVFCGQATQALVMT
jgi:hypothetical protein